MENAMIIPTSSSGVHTDKGEAIDRFSRTTAPKTCEGKHLVRAVADRLEKIFSKNSEILKTEDSSEVSAVTSDHEDCAEENTCSYSFEEAIETMKLHDDGHDLPEKLQGGILLDRTMLFNLMI
ncbi:hypothetical protein SAY86_006544 [Trapa natans]|uniref:Uncharacterized protein n=1 Tax=Trapa natans TaxID=22666 RepID=A0AAN7LDN6_TRANT|nr:hypothetical protein SAY86_006544 [Trapa natans]